MIRITKEEFDTFVRRKEPEVFTKSQIDSWVLAHQETILKSEIDELNDIEKAEVEAFNSEFCSFMQVEVVSTSDDLLSKGLKYETFYIREKQVEFEKSEGDDIEKSKHGKYTDTAHNRKMGRVGSEFGAAKKEEEKKPEESNKERDSLIQNAIRHGHSRKTAEKFADDELKSRTKKEDEESPMDKLTHERKVKEGLKNMQHDKPAGGSDEDPKFKDGTSENKARVDAINAKGKEGEPGTVEDDDPAVKEGKDILTNLKKEYEKQSKGVKKELTKVRAELESLLKKQPKERVEGDNEKIIKLWDERDKLSNESMVIYDNYVKEMTDNLNKYYPDKMSLFSED